MMSSTFPRWNRPQNASGNFQSFHVQVPIIYHLPSFSPRWDDYGHDESQNNKTTVLKTEDGEDKVCVYSAAQLQLLWEAIFIEGLKRDQQSVYQQVAGSTFKVSTNTFNTVLGTYPNMDHIAADEIPDLANLSGYWVTQEDRSIIIKKLYEIYPEGSYDKDDKLLEDIPVDPEFVKLAAKAYGIAPDVASTFTTMKQISDALYAAGKITDKEVVFSGVVFYPATIVSPEWYQYPLSGYAKGRSPLSVLTTISDKFQLHDVHLAVKNTGNSSYCPIVKMGLFKSATIPVVTSMNNIANTGAYNVQILGKSGDHFDLYTANGKEVSCAPTTQEYALYPAVESWGYNLVVKAEIEWSNFFNNNNTSVFKNLLLPVWEGEINYTVDIICLVPFLTTASFLQRLSDMYLNQLVEESGSGGGDQPTPTVTTLYPGAVPYYNVNRTNLVSKTHSKNALTSSRKLNKTIRIGDDASENDLYLQDTSIIGVLTDPSSYPLQQGVSFGGLKSAKTSHKITQYVEVKGGEETITPVDPEEPVAITDGTIMSPVCAGTNTCYRRGVCTRPINELSQIVISEYKVKNNIEAGAKMGIVIGLDEIYAANPVAVNKTNVDHLTEVVEQKQTDGIYTTQSLCAEKPEGKDFETIGDEVVMPPTDGLYQAMSARAVLAASARLGKNGTPNFNWGFLGNLAKQVGGVVQKVAGLFTNSDATEVQFVSSELGIPEDFKPYKDPVTFDQAYSTWTPEFKSFVDKLHPNFKEIPYFLNIGDEDLSNYTPGQVAISKSEVTNMCVSLGSTYHDGGAFVDDYRSLQNPCDHFSALTSNYCFVILSSIPYGKEGFDKVSVVCNKPGSFLVAPTPCKVSQVSVAGGASGASIYGQVQANQQTYNFFNNAMITSINDLSGVMRFMLPAKIPVLGEDNQVTLVDIKSYLSNSENRIYVSIYNMVEMDISAKFGSGLKFKGTDDHQICLALWNYDRPAESEYPFRTDLKMPQIPASTGWMNGRIARLDHGVNSMGVLCKYFYMVTDKTNVPQTSIPADAEIPQNGKSKKKLDLTKKSPYQIQKMIEKKLPSELKVQIMHIGK